MGPHVVPYIAIYNRIVHRVFKFFIVIVVVELYAAAPQ